MPQLGDIWGVLEGAATGHMGSLFACACASHVQSLALFPSNYRRRRETENDVSIEARTVAMPICKLTLGKTCQMPRLYSLFHFFPPEKASA